MQTIFRGANKKLDGDARLRRVGGVAYGLQVHAHEDGRATSCWLADEHGGWVSAHLAGNKGAEHARDLRGFLRLVSFVEHFRLHLDSHLEGEWPTLGSRSERDLCQAELALCADPVGVESV